MTDPLADPLAPSSSAREGGATSLVVPIQRRIVQFVDGVPTLIVQAMLTKNHVQDIILAAASQPYTGSEKEFEGMTNMEVMVVKQVRRAAATGEGADTRDILDRILGKPKFTGEILNVNKSYEDALREIEEKERRARTIDVTPRPSQKDPLAP